MLRSTIPLLFLLVLLPCVSGTNGEVIYQTVREGDDATLSCKDVLPDQNQCQFTTWITGKLPSYIGLFMNGQRNDRVSLSMSLLPSCSLVLYKVTVELAEDYTCQQDKNDRKIEPTEFQLFVASLSQQKEGDRVTLTCSVTPKQCQHKVKWLNSGVEVTTDHKELQMSRSGCGVSVSFTDHSPPSPFYQTLQCEVRQQYTNKIFVLSPQPPSDEKTTATEASMTPISSGTAARSAPTSLRANPSTTQQTSPQTEMTTLSVIVAVSVVAIVALTVACVALMLWRRRKGSGDANGDTVSPDDGVAYASVQFNQKKTNNRKSPQSRGREEDVTYSSVNVSSHKPHSKTGDPEDSVTYAAVNFDQNKKKKSQEGSGVGEENVTYSAVNVAQSDPPQLYASVHKTTPRNKEL